LEAGRRARRGRPFRTRLSHLVVGFLRAGCRSGRTGCLLRFIVTACCVLCCMLPAVLWYVPRCGLCLVTFLCVVPLHVVRVCLSTRPFRCGVSRCSFRADVLSILVAFLFGVPSAAFVFSCCCFFCQCATGDEANPAKGGSRGRRSRIPSPIAPICPGPRQSLLSCCSLL
jgi:hypothetical protein